jgi:thioesterase domain-containing protein
VTYLEQVRRVQSDGPYLLGGFCVGGVVAIEMARLLKEQGAHCGTVLLLDSHVPGKRGSLSARDRLQIHKERLQEEGIDYLRFWARQKYEWESAQLLARLGIERPVDAATQYQSDLVHAAIEASMREYEPRPYDGDAALFRPPLAPRHRLSGGREVNVRRVFLLEDNGWRRVVRSLQVFELASPPGDHDGFVLEPYVRDLAVKLRPFLENATPGRS